MESPIAKFRVPIMNTKCTTVCVSLELGAPSMDERESAMPRGL